jgi:FtsP/CotA-like multicopper oxidase with cupredoxin domain
MFAMHTSRVKSLRVDQDAGAATGLARSRGWPERRYVLRGIGRAGVAALLAPGLSLSRPDRAKAARERLIQPPEIRSRNGELSVTLTAAPSPMRLGDVEFPGFLFNNAYLPPLLRVRVGDVLQVRLRNNLLEGFSNLHFHGMSVSPRARSDNVFVHVSPGHGFEYEVIIPSAGRQGPGLFWYHPHGHGFVTRQMLGGLSGALVVEGSETLFPILKDLPERFILIKQAEPGGGRAVISVNGQMNPTVEIRHGEVQFWRIAHIGATLFAPFRFSSVSLYVIATDGHPLSRPRKMSEFLLGPGQRIDAIAIGPPPGENAIATLPFKNMACREIFPCQQVATIVSAGPPASANVEAEVLRRRVGVKRWIDEVPRARSCAGEGSSIHARRTVACS